LAGAGCDKGKELAKTTSRIAGYIDTGTQIIDRQTAAGRISKESGLAIAETLLKLNAINQQLIVESKQYVQPDESLALPEDAKSRYVALIGTATTLTTGLLTDPRITALPDVERQKWVVFVTDLSDTFKLLASFVNSKNHTMGGK
jgi:hypothetical protein